MTRRPEVWRPGARRTFAGPALVDTHIWIWYLDGAKERLPAEAIRLLRRCVGGEGLWVSDISVWEAGTKVAKGRLTLSPDVSAWLARAERQPGFSFLPLDRQILLSSTQLPGTVHGDPADRMLIATASLSGMPLVTADELIVEYATAEGGFSVCDARPGDGR
jgi:PIN domain nuclease of toxin-antitoxin system